MPIQPATSPNLVPGKEGFTSAVIEKQLVENLNSLQDEESLIKPHFGEVLSNLNAVQSKPLSAKNIDSKAKTTVGSGRAKSHQDNNLISRDSLVKKKNSREINSHKADNTPKKLTVQPAIKNRSLSSKSEQEYKEETKSNSQQYEATSGEGLEKLSHTADYTTPICLNDKFIYDTLQGINAQQTLAFDPIKDDPSGVRSNVLVTQMLSTVSSLTNETTAPSAHIEVQAATIHTNLLLDDGQMSVIANLAVQETETIELVTEFIPLVDGTNEDEEIQPLEAEPKIKLSSEQEGTVRSQTLNNQTIVTDQSRQVEQIKGQTSLNSQTSIQSISSSSLNIQGGIGGRTVIGGSSQTNSFSEVMSQSNLERVNTIMQVKDHFRSLLKNQESHLKVNLAPESLGSIEITIDIVKDTVMATFIKAERRETMELLARNAKEIDKIFQESGLQSNLANMNFSSDQDRQLDRDETPRQKASPASEPQKVEETSLNLETDINPDALVDIKA